MAMSNPTRPWEALRGCFVIEEGENCQFFWDDLYLFVSDEAAGRPVDELYPEMAHHLDCCPACLAEYELLAHLFHTAIDGNFEGIYE